MGVKNVERARRQTIIANKCVRVYVDFFRLCHLKRAIALAIIIVVIIWTKYNVLILCLKPSISLFDPFSSFFLNKKRAIEAFSLRYECRYLISWWRHALIQWMCTLKYSYLPVYLIWRVWTCMDKKTGERRKTKLDLTFFDEIQTRERIYFPYRMNWRWALKIDSFLRLEMFDF